MKIPSILLISSVLVGCAGGGSNDTKSSTPTPTPITPTIPTYPVSTTETGASTFRSAGYSGSGVTVAVLDTGISYIDDVSNDTISRTNQSYIYSNDAIIKDPTKSTFLMAGNNRHADHMAGAITGSKGIAPQAYVISGNIAVDDNGSSSTLNMTGALNDLANQAFIFNASYAYFGAHYYINTNDNLFKSWNSGFDKLKQNNTLFVHSGGNDGGTISSRLVSTTSTQTDLIKSDISNNVLLVGASEANDTLSWYSTKPGTDPMVQSRWITAFSGSITVINGVSQYTTGTSNAAANVSAGAALMKQKWNHLGGREISNILLTTANRSFSGYSSENYGRGIMDLNAAFSPVGVPTASLTSTTPFYINSISLPTGTTASKFTISVFDSYGRNFETDGSIGVKSSSPMMLFDEKQNFETMGYAQKLDDRKPIFSFYGSDFKQQFIKPTKFIGDYSSSGVVLLDGYNSGYILEQNMRNNDDIGAKQSMMVGVTRFVGNSYISSNITTNPRSLSGLGEYETTPTQTSLTIGKKFHSGVFAEVSASYMKFGGDSSFIKDSYINSNSLKFGYTKDFAGYRFAIQHESVFGSGDLNINHALGRDEFGEIKTTTKVPLEQSYNNLDLSVQSKNLFIGTKLSSEPSMNTTFIGYKLFF